MTRRERICTALPSAVLEVMLAFPLWRAWWSAAYLEFWKRDVENVIAETSDRESGPWPCAMPAGMH